jgi:tetratricopeptide (TPR) repeat protein
MRLILILLGLLLCNAPAANSAGPDLGNLFAAAEIDYQTGRLDSALTKLDEHDKLKGKSGNALDLRGAIALEQGNFDAARKALTEAHQLEPGLFAPRLRLGDLALREKKYAEAGAIYQQLLRETNVLMASERSRYGLLIVALAGHDEPAAKRALASIQFPTESPAYYFAQAAWEFAHGNNGPAKKWIATASGIFAPPLLAWFSRPLYDLGWQKEKPPPPVI